MRFILITEFQFYLTIDGDDEKEMNCLVKLMEKLAELNKFVEKIKNNENLEPIEEMDNINGSFIHQN